MPSTEQPQASTTNARDVFEWVSGEKAQFREGLCISKARDGTGFYVGIKGWDTKRGAPGFIQIKMTPTGLQDAAALLQRKVPEALDLATKPRPSPKPGPVAAAVQAAGILAGLLTAAAALGLAL